MEALEENDIAMHPFTSVVEYQSLFFCFCLKQNMKVIFCHMSGAVCDALQIKIVDFVCVHHNEHLDQLWQMPWR